MDNEKKSGLRRLTDKLYGGLNMSWLTVILFAVGTAVLTTIFLVVPIFKDTSFYRMGVTFEAWIFFAIIIMANCKKPLESALKTFVFFLVSQPLIYLFQVPFSWQGWGLFGYYRFWFILTLLTFPAAFVGWYINKKNWLSVLILSPILISLAGDSFGGFRDAVRYFPKHIVMAIFCLAQIVIYIYTFMPDVKKRIVGALVPILTAIVMAVIMAIHPFSVAINDYLPDQPELTDSAVVSVEDSEFADVSITDYEEAYVHIEAHKYGTTTMTVTDGEQEYRYTIEVYDDNGINRISITAIE